VEGADIVYTDVWASMGQEGEAAARTALMRPYAVTARLFASAKPDALFMHCLPAHPGEEVEQAVLDNPRSVVFDEAENRLHVQKAILSVLSRSRGD
jgi:ornithine carbamoyltransferase